MTKPMGLHGFNVEQRIKLGRNGKVPNHYTARLKIEREVEPRPTRKGLLITKWPHEHLATLVAMQMIHSDWNMELLERNRPDIFKSYFERNGRQLTRNVVCNRLDKGIRQREQKNYESLIPSAVKSVKRWKRI